MQSLDNILSAGGESASEGQATETEQNVTQAGAEGQTTEGEGSTEGQTAEGEGEGTRVPVAALQAERQKVKRYTEQVADFEKSVSGLRSENANLSRQVSELLQRLPRQEQPQPEPTDFFADPDKALNERLQSHLGQAFGPVQEQLIAQAQMLAGIKYGDDKVAAAEEAFVAAARAGTLDPAVFHSVRNSPNRYAAAVQWHQRQQAQAEIGDDPAAYKAKLEADLRAQILAELNGGNGQQQTQERPAVGAMPSNLAAARNMGSRSGPAWAGPASLQDIFDRRPGKG